MHFSPPVDETITIPPVDDRVRNFIFENLEGMFRIQVSRKRDRKKHETVGKVEFGDANTSAGQNPNEDPDEIVEGMLRIAMHYCENKRPEDEEGPITFRFLAYVASPQGRPKRPSMDWTYNPDSQEQEIVVSDPEGLGEDPLGRAYDRQSAFNLALINKLDEKDRQLMRMYKMSTMQFEPLMQMLQFMGYGWLQGLQMQTNAVQVIAESQQGLEEKRQAGERLKVVGNVLQKALPTLAEKFGIFTVMKAAEKMGLSKEETKELLQRGSTPTPPQSAPAISESTSESSFSIEDQNPLASLASAFAHLLRPSQWRLITSTLTANEFEIFQKMTESTSDASVIQAYDAFMQIPGEKLAALWEALDSEQATELMRFGELVEKTKTSAAEE